MIVPYPNVHGCRLKNPDDFQQDSFRTQERDHEGKKYSAIMGKLNGQDAMTDQSFRYEDSIWTEASAKKHCEDHGGSFIGATKGENLMYPNREILNFSHNNNLADSEPSWANVDKTALPRGAFADMGEADKKSSWGYPHHWVQNAGGKDDAGIWTTGTMYLHESGLNAAWAAAQGARSGQSASAAVKAHLDAHRKALGKTDKANVIDFQGITMKAQDNNPENAEIWIYDEIGSGWFGGMSAKDFADQFKALGNIKDISLRINSPGGDVFDGLAIYNILKQSSAKITVYIDGLAASIASIIAMAGDEINMAQNALMMIHKAWGMTIGNADEMQKMSDTLTKLDGTLAGTYAKKTNMDLGLINQMMADETWMTSEEAMTMGFITNITDEMKLAAHFDLDKFKFRNVPRDRQPMQPDNPENIGQPMPPDLSMFDEAISKCQKILERMEN